MFEAIEHSHRGFHKINFSVILNEVKYLNRLEI